jgi:hypothetical protein
VTLKLVSDNTVELPVGNLMDIGGMARRFADDAEAGDHGDILRTVVVVQNEDGALRILGWGENTSSFELMGLFEAAKLRVFADDLIHDDE